jgi:hypothetical protein
MKYSLDGLYYTAVRCGRVLVSKWFTPANGKGTYKASVVPIAGPLVTRFAYVFNIASMPCFLCYILYCSLLPILLSLCV